MTAGPALASPARARAARGVVSGSAFIYSIRTRRYRLLRPHGSLSTKSTFYGIWQDGGPGSPRYTLAGGSSAHGGRRGFLINYSQRAGRFGRPFFFTYASRPVPTHFDGITAVPGGFNLVALAVGHGPAMAHVRGPGSAGFSRARWWLVPVSSSALCPCQVVTGDTVWRNRAMGLYVNSGDPPPAPTWPSSRPVDPRQAGPGGPAPGARVHRPGGPATGRPRPAACCSAR